MQPAKSAMRDSVDGTGATEWATCHKKEILISNEEKGELVSNFWGISRVFALLYVFTFCFC